jgi:hypothetical protein
MIAPRMIAIALLIYPSRVFAVANNHTFRFFTKFARGYLLLWRARVWAPGPHH